MADVRSLLRQERAARQQATKPARPTRTSAAPATAPMGKKRKAVDDEPETRKRTKAEEDTGVPSGFFDGGAIDEAQAASPTEERDLRTDAREQTLEPSEPPAVLVADEPAPVVDEVDEELWAAFERDVATPPPERHNVPALAAAATIQAAPMSAAELAAQAREDMSAQRGRRDAEIEAEKEDAARQLEDEFDEMESWEERARKLREKREALRKARDLSAPPVQEIVAEPPEASEDEESEDDFEEDGWGDWGVRAA